jgi:MFS family permease
MWQSLREGLNYVRQRPSLQVLLLLQFMIAFLVFPYAILLPVFARDIFHIGAPGLGLLNSASGIGAMLGALLLVVLSQRLKRGKPLLIILCVLGGLAGLAFALVNTLDAALLVLVVLGACTVMSMTTTNTTLQILTPDEMRGRVLSIWVMTALGLAPLGNLLAGWVAQSIGAPPTLMIGGSLCATGALLIAIISNAVSSNGPRAASEANRLPMRFSIHGKAKKVNGMSTKEKARISKENKVSTMQASSSASRR